MNYPMLRPERRREYRVDRFLGLDRRPAPPAGSFRDLADLSGEDYPFLRVRPGRSAVTQLEGCPTDRVLALGGKGFPVVLDASGSLWAGGHVLPRLLGGTLSLTVLPNETFSSVAVAGQSDILAALDADGDYRFVYDQHADLWVREDGLTSFDSELLVCSPLPLNGDALTLRLTTQLVRPGVRDLVMMGGWVCVFPDGIYANAVKLRQGSVMTEGEDYGPIARQNVCEQGGAVFTPCTADGRTLSLTCSAQAPASGLWVDTTEPVPTLRIWSQSSEAWVETAPYVKCQIPGIAKGLSAGDGVLLNAMLTSGQQGESEIDRLWSGSKVLVDARHDPGDVNRDEGTRDYVILPGLISGEIELELTWHNRDFFQIDRTLPEMDFVVEAQNRLWGCRWGGGVNELYGCKLGDFRNWEVFEGLSTDAYRVTRGQGGPFTGAAVLGGCPLFFRENSLEKIYPSSGGDHGVVTVDLEGIRPGSARSAVVIRDRLYYHAGSGVVRYDGTLPVPVSQALGRERFHSAVAGARDGLYYVDLTDSRGQAAVYVYDPQTGLWHRERDRLALCWGQGQTLYFARTPGGPLFRADPDGSPDGVDWYAETGPLGPFLRNRRYLSRLQLTARLDPGAELRVFLSYDDGPWQAAGQFRSTRTEAEVFSVFPRRSGSVRLRLEGRGGMELRALSWLLEQGSDVVFLPL